MLLTTLGPCEEDCVSRLEVSNLEIEPVITSFILGALGLELNPAPLLPSSAPWSGNPPDPIRSKLISPLKLGLRLLDLGLVLRFSIISWINCRRCATPDPIRARSRRPTRFILISGSLVQLKPGLSGFRL